MTLHPRVSRTLYKSLLSAARGLQHELDRCAQLRTRELDHLRAAAAAALPRELRGLLDVRNLKSPHYDLPAYITTCARRISEAAQAPDFCSLDAAVGFAALKHINSRVDALRHLVYTTSSDAEHHGIRVAIESSYQGADRERYFFRYQVRILNESAQTVQLLSRAWTIRDLDGRVTSVEGPGVVGAFPTLAPSDTYQYSSAVPLHTPVGTQSGHYIFILPDKEPVEVSKRMLHVPIAPFSYRTPSMDANAPETFVPVSSSKATRRRRRDEMRRR